MTQTYIISAITFADGHTRFYHSLPLSRDNAIIAVALRAKNIPVIVAMVGLN